MSDYLGRESLITAKEMSAKSFIYIVSKENIYKREYVEDINKARLAALKYQIDFTVEEVGDNLNDLQKKLDAMNEATRSTTAIYSADR